MSPTLIPGIEYADPPRAQSKASSLAWPPRLIVVHDTGNTSSTRYNEASYAASRTDDSSKWTSAHAYIDEGGPLGSLRLGYRAWAAYSYANQYGLHLEMCLRGDRTKTRTITAALVRQLCDMTGIPKTKLTPAQVAAGHHGICGHYDVTVGLGVGDHTDPGPDFPWSWFMNLVNGGSSAQSTGGTMASTPLTQESQFVNDAFYGIAAILSGNDAAARTNPDGTSSAARPNGLMAAIRAMSAKLDLVASKVDIDPAELAAIEDAAKQGAQAGVLASADALADALAAKLPSADRAELVSAVREVFADAGAA